MRRQLAGLILALLVFMPGSRLFGQDKEAGALRFKAEAAVAGEYVTLGHLADLPPELAQKCGQAQSPNIIKALDAAKRKKLKTVFFTGLKGEKTAAKTTFPFVVPSDNTPRVQETHITLGHVICLMVEDILFDQPRKKSL